MTTPTKVRLSSKIMREPQVFDRLGNFDSQKEENDRSKGLGNLAGGIARDLVIWAAWNNVENVTLLLPAFCQQMGYNRQHLLKKVSQAYEQQLKARGWHPEDAEHLAKTTLGYALGILAVQPLTFRTVKQAAVNSEGKLTNERSTTKFLPTISNVDLIKKRSGTVIKFKLDKKLLKECQTVYQTLTLDDYLSLKTPGGHPDDQARKMYLRCVWKRKYWDSPKNKDQGKKKTFDSYEELKAVAGLKFANEAKSACHLRSLLKRIGELPSVKMVATIERNTLTGNYEVRWEREPLEKPELEEVTEEVEE